MTQDLQVRVVGRPRVFAVLTWCAMLAIGLGLLATGSTGAVVVGGCFTVLNVFGLVATLRGRVWVEGNVLHSRSLRGDGPPIRLDRLTEASLSPFGRNSGRQLCLSDADGATVQLEATNVRLARLYAVLAEHIRHDDPIANDLLQRRMAKHRPGLPFGPG